MTTVSSTTHALMRNNGWDAEAEALTAADGVLVSPGNLNAYLVTTPGGDVVVNTGPPVEAPEHRRRFEAALGRPLDVRKMIFTQSHGAHWGGWPAYDAPGVEMLAQSHFMDIQEERARLDPFFERRTFRIFWSVMGERRDPRRRESIKRARRPEILTFVGDAHAFDLGGRRFELYAAPGGETLDGLFVWLPDERIALIAHMLGPHWGSLPNLYTLRGERLRSALLYVRQVDLLRELAPAVLLRSHGTPVSDEDEIQATLRRLRDAVLHIHDATVSGMNAGKDLWTLMKEIRLPPELAVGEEHGKVSWCVRTVWEEYSGWFRFESTTELYAVPPRTVRAELCALAGGPEVIADAAAAHVAADRPLEALHLIEVALESDPRHRGLRETQIAALEILLERTGGENWSEVRWLETEIEWVREALR
jgi:glyoxylase-like metal-dependent hydrolase (beta-lactamase superfamily II)